MRCSNGHCVWWESNRALVPAPQAGDAIRAHFFGKNAHWNARFHFLRHSAGLNGSRMAAYHSATHGCPDDHPPDRDLAAHRRDRHREPARAYADDRPSRRPTACMCGGRGGRWSPPAPQSWPPSCRRMPTVSGSCMCWGFMGTRWRPSIRIATATQTGVRLGADAYGYPRAFSYLPTAEDRDWLRYEAARARLDAPERSGPDGGRREHPLRSGTPRRRRPSPTTSTQLRPSSSGQPSSGRSAFA